VGKTFLKSIILLVIVKLLLNALWGRFALRNQLSTTVFVNNDTELAKYLNDKHIEIEQCEQMTERTFMVVYKTKEEHCREHDCSNLILALWTTSAARVHLLKEMQRVLERKDTRILYYGFYFQFALYANLQIPTPFSTNMTQRRAIPWMMASSLAK